MAQTDFDPTFQSHLDRFIFDKDSQHFNSNMLGFSYIVALIACLYVTGAEAAVSVAYLANADHPQIVNGNFVSNAQFSATQIADMYNRLSGIPPLLREGMCQLRFRPNANLISRS